ncbi:MAG TPA: hypothetical protein VGH80_12305 [Xanthomonadaceae bacterium]|jgi:signal transduction histidine kinase
MTQPAQPHPDPAAARAGGRDPVGQAAHDLRNGLNTLLMNAAVLGARIDDMPESLRPFVGQIATAGRKCSDDLTRLLDLVASSRS